MTINDLITQLITIRDGGLTGLETVKAFNPDSEQMETVTGLLYGGTDGIVEICTDEP